MYVNVNTPDATFDPACNHVLVSIYTELAGRSIRTFQVSLVCASRGYAKYIFSESAMCGSFGLLRAVCYVSTRIGTVFYYESTCIALHVHFLSIEAVPVGIRLDNHF